MKHILTFDFDLVCLIFLVYSTTTAMAPQTRSALRDKTIQNTPKPASPKPKPKARKKGKAKIAVSKPKRTPKLTENLDENQDENENENRGENYDENHDENQDENAHDSDAENSNVPVRRNVGEPLGKPLKPTHKVFQDITDRFVAPASPSPLELTPSRHTPRPPLRTLGRPRRKPKIPTIAVKPTPRKVIPSSLPPSSPPSASSRPTFDIKAPVFGNPFDDDDEVDPLQNSDFGTDLPPLASPRLAPTPPPYNDNPSSDPFGFLALEKKLKAQREASTHPIQSNPETINTSSSHELPVFAAHAPASPPKRTSSSSPPLILTPTQNGRKRAKRKWSSIDPNSNRSSMPSSPSPMKRRQNPETEAEVEDEVEEVIDEDDGEDETETEAKEQKRPAKKPRGSGDPVDPIGLAKSLTALLPKRPNARAKGGRKKKVVESDSDEEDEDVKPKRKGKGKGKAVYKGKGKGKANAMDMDEDMDDEEKEVCISLISRKDIVFTELLRRNGLKQGKHVGNISRSWKATLLQRRMFTLFEV